MDGYGTPGLPAHLAARLRINRVTTHARGCSGATHKGKLADGAERASCEIHQFRAMPRAISPLIWLVAFRWQDVHLNRFEIRGRGYEVYPHLESKTTI